MQIVVHGLSHRTAPLDVRERVAFHPDELAEALAGAPVVQQRLGLLGAHAQLGKRRRHPLVDRRRLGRQVQFQVRIGQLELDTLHRIGGGR